MPSAPARPYAPDLANRRLGIGLLVSLAVHALLLSLHFGVAGMLQGGGAPVAVSLARAPAAPLPELPPEPVPAPAPAPAPATAGDPAPPVPRPGFRLFDPVPLGPPPAPVQESPRPAARRRRAARPPAPPRDAGTPVIARQDKPDAGFKMPLAEVQPLPEPLTVEPHASAGVALAQAEPGIDEEGAALEKEAERQHQLEEERRRRLDEDAQRLAQAEAARAAEDALAREAQARRLADEEQARREQAAAEREAARQREREAAEKALAEQQRQLQEREQLQARQKAEAEAEAQARQLAQRRSEEERQRAVQLARQETERWAAEQKAAEHRAEQERARRHAEALARQVVDEAAAAGKGNDGRGGGTLPRDMPGNNMGSRARELLRGIELPGAAPAALRPAPEPDARRRVVDTAERDVPLRLYVDSFRQKIERNAGLIQMRMSGTPGRPDPLVSVAVRSDGSIDDVTIVRSSGRADTDEAVRRIVRLNARYAAFPPNVASRFDVIEIRRIWLFAETLKLLEEVR